MKITEVRINKAEDGGKLKAYASVTFDGVFVAHGFKIIDGEKGEFVGMPNRKDSKGEFRDICHPIDKEFREELIKAIMDEFNK